MTKKEFDAAMHGFRVFIPDYMVDGLERYLVHRIRPGDFMYALFANDLLAAFNRADDANTLAMKGWTIVIANVFPFDAYGSYDTVNAYIAQKDRE